MQIALKDLGFLLKSEQYCKKCTFLDKLRVITQEENLKTRKTRKMTSFFIYFFYSVAFIFVFENSQNSFSCGPLFDPFWSVKFRNFQQKLPILATHHTFIESKHPAVAKNPCYVLSQEESQKLVSIHGLYLCIVHLQSLFCSVPDYISLCFLPLQLCNFLLSLFYKSCFLSNLLDNLTNLAFEFYS